MASSGWTNEDDRKNTAIEIASRNEWRRIKALKARIRVSHFEKKLQQMQDRYNHLRQLECGVIASGRWDFNADEIYQMLFMAYVEARPGKRGTYDVQRIESNLFDNIYRLAVEIAERRYHPLRSETFIVFDPVIREIFAASFRDRIVHHLIINICISWWNQYFVRDSYSCRVGKGTDYGVRRAAHHIGVQTKGYTKRAYFVKMDIKGFFMSMPREMLFDLAIRGAHQQFHKFGPLGRLLAYLWREVIMDEPLEQVKVRGKIKNWDDLPRDKSLFFQNAGRGIVIGNLTSQLLSNIFLDALDKFIIYQLGYHHYGRYVDDFYIVVTEDEVSQLERDIERIRSYLFTMGLTLHPHKTRWIDTRRGVDYLGHILHHGHIEMDRRYQHNYYRALIDVERGLKDIETVTSYMGGCVNYGYRKMQQRIWELAGQEFEL